MIDRSINSESDCELYGQSNDVLRAKLLHRQDTDWSHGVRISVEQILDEFPSVRDKPELLLDLIHNEFYLRHERGEKPELADYQHRFPDLSEPLRIQWEVDQLLFINSVDTASERDTGVTAPSRHRVGRYEVQFKLGEGGIGVAYKAWDPLLRRVVALKLLKAGRHATSEEVARFRIEAEAIARVRHENVVQVFDVGEVNGEPFIAMEYCASGTLADRLRQSPLSPHEAAEIVQQIADGVAAAHHMQIIHRDLKPANVFLQPRDTSALPNQTTGPHDDTSDDLDELPTNSANKSTINMGVEELRSAAVIPKVSDFGLAKLVDHDDRQTRTGILLGTPAYMAPEQAFGGHMDVTPSVDVYALGALLYETLTGRPPFQGSTPAETLDQVRQREPISIRQLQPAVPIDLQTIASKCLSKEACNRYVSVAEVHAELQRFLDGQPILARPISRLERLRRWARRNPGIAGLSTSVFALLLCLTIGSLAASILLLNERDAARRSEMKAIAADEQRLEKLYQAYLGESRASRRLGALGQRASGLQAIREIIAAYSEKKLSKAQQVELRDEAIAALALPDLKVIDRRPAELYTTSTVFHANSTATEYPDWNSRTGEISIRQISDGKLLQRLPGRTYEYPQSYQFYFSECGTWFLDVLQYPRQQVQEVGVWEWRKGKKLYTLKSQYTWSRAIVHPVTMKILASCNDSRLRRFDLLTGNEESVSPQQQSVSDMAANPTGRKLVVVSDRSSPEILDAETWRSLEVLSEAGPCSSVAWDSHDKWILCTPLSKPIYHWDTRGSWGFFWSHYEPSRVNAVKICSDSTVALSFWTGVNLRDKNLIVPEAPGHFLGFYDGGRRFATHHDREVICYERDAEITRRPIPTKVEFATFSPDGQWLAVSSIDGVSIYDGQTFEKVGNLQLDNSGPVVFDPRNRDFITFGMFIHTWRWPITCLDATSRKFRLGPPSQLPIARHRNSFTSIEQEPHHYGRHVAFDREGRRLAIAGMRFGEIWVWDRDSDKEPRLFLKTKSSERVALSPDGKLLAAASTLFPRAHVWRYDTKEQLLEVPEVAHVLFSPDGHWLALSESSRVHLYEVRDGTPQLRRTLERIQPDLYIATAIAFSPDSRLLAMAHSNTQIRLFDLRTGETAAMLTHPNSAYIKWLSFDNNSRLAATRWGADVTIWDLSRLKAGLSSLELDDSAFPDRQYPIASATAQVEIDRGTLPPPTQWAVNWRKLAYGEIADQKQADAISAVREALLVVPYSDSKLKAELLIQSAEYKQRNGDLDGAKVEWEQALKLRSKSRLARTAVCRISLFGPTRLHDPQRVEQLLAPRLLESGTAKDDVSVQQDWEYYGCAQIRMGKFKEGLIILTQHIASDADPLPRYMEALARNSLADGTAAKAVYDAAKKLDAAHRNNVPAEVRADWDRIRIEIGQLINQPYGI